MSLWTSLEPASATVEPGSSTQVRLRVRNTGDVVDEYRFEPVGDLAPWTTVEPAVLRLYPGTTGTVELTFAPPRTPDAKAGPNPYAVRITPTEHPDAVTVPEGNLTILPFSEMRAELVPTTVAGRLRGRPRLAVDNLGNTKLTTSMTGEDNGDQLSYEIRPSNAQIEPGRAHFIDVTLRPKRIIWFGSKEQHPFKVAVQRAGVPPEAVDGTYVQRGFLPRWLATLLGILLALVLAFVMFWFSHKPAVSTRAEEQMEQVGSSLAPSPSAQPSLPAQPSAPAESPAAQPQPQESEKDDGGGGGKPKESTAPKKPKEETAADAVRALSAKEPDKKHMCMRARTGRGHWSKPNCDSTFAGIHADGNTFGEPFTGLNLASYNMGGISAAALVQNPGGAPKWLPTTPVTADGNNVYIGEHVETGTPDPTTFAGLKVTIGNGQLCHTVHFVNTSKLGDWICVKKPRPDYLFVGTTSNGNPINGLALIPSEL
ncbi:hydrolase [Streptomyces sp. NPDC088923]|uniref:COG1470 family protein n=1 Tax=Streptomyces sp. NPDC088923 TaxID=3365913 RepID=UPI003812CFCD